MGHLAKLNQWRKKGERPRSAVLKDELKAYHDAHTKDGKSTLPKFHTVEIKRLRDRYDNEFDLMQKRHDQELETLSVEAFKMELGYIAKFCQGL